MINFKEGRREKNHEKDLQRNIDAEGGEWKMKALCQTLMKVLDTCSVIAKNSPKYWRAETQKSERIGKKIASRALLKGAINIWDKIRWNDAFQSSN